MARSRGARSARHTQRGCCGVYKMEYAVRVLRCLQGGIRGAGAAVSTSWHPRCGCCGVYKLLFAAQSCCTRGAPWRISDARMRRFICERRRRQLVLRSRYSRVCSRAHCALGHTSGTLQASPYLMHALHPGMRRLGVAVSLIGRHRVPSETEWRVVPSEPEWRAVSSEPEWLVVPSERDTLSSSSMCASDGSFTRRA